MTREKLEGEALASALAACDRWLLEDHGTAIRRLFRFRSFSAAFGFMAECAVIAEKLVAQSFEDGVPTSPDFDHASVCMTTASPRSRSSETTKGVGASSPVSVRRGTFTTGC